tara:strand:- start:14543 stop:15241 length:699 start_codon:yes stop_codon:yes gene_type:complete
MKLTPNHIQELYKFTRQHYVYHYDVQSELVDHLANDIEEIWKDNPKISFEDARDKSFKKFGIFGFMDVIEAKQIQVGKKYRKILWRFIKDWFKLPKVILTLLIFIFFYSIMSLQINENYLLSFMLILGLVDGFYAYKITRKSKKRFEQKKVKYVLEDMIFNAGAFGSVLVFSNLFHLSSLIEYSNSVYYKSIVAFLITLAIIYSYVSLVVLPKKAEELLQETYPEYKLVKNL